VKKKPDFTITKKLKVKPADKTFKLPKISFKNRSKVEIRVTFMRKDGKHGKADKHCFDKDYLDIPPGKIGKEQAQRQTYTIGTVAKRAGLKAKADSLRQGFDINF